MLTAGSQCLFARNPPGFGHSRRYSTSLQKGDCQSNNRRGLCIASLSEDTCQSLIKRRKDAVVALDLELRANASSLRQIGVFHAGSIGIPLWALRGRILDTWLDFDCCTEKLLGNVDSKQSSKNAGSRPS